MVSARLADELLSRPLLQVQKRSSQESSYALTIGVQAMTVGILGQSVIIASELALVTVLLVGLLAIDPLLTVFTAGFFALIALILHFLLAEWAVRIGDRESRAGAASYAAIQESLRGYREVTVSGRRAVYTNKFHDLVWQVARVQSDRMMITSIGKYVFEVALIVGAGLLVLAQLRSGDFSAAAAIIVVFFAAASRIMPSLLRLQTAALNLRLASGTARVSTELIEDLNTSQAADHVSTERLNQLLIESAKNYPGFKGSILIDEASLTYPGNDHPALENISLDVPYGTSLALVGSTGAGKSTLGDVILGVINPDSGSVAIDGMAPAEVVKKWPGVLAYVPQAVAVVNGTVRENVAMGLPDRLIDDDRVWEALDRAQLGSFLRSAREGLDTLVGEHGVKLSGGQRQRLGIARALYTRPRLLVMDEATSALDSETESKVTETLNRMTGGVTLVVIAHRLATIRLCSQVAYLEKGRVMAVGSFNEVRRNVPMFDHQSRLMEL